MSNPLTAVQLADSPIGLWVLDEAAAATVAVNQGSAGTGFNGTIGANVTMGVAAAMAGTTGAQFTNPAATSTYADIIHIPRDTGNAHGLQPATHLTFEAVIKSVNCLHNFTIASYGQNPEGTNFSVPYQLTTDVSTTPTNAASNVNDAGSEYIVGTTDIKNGTYIVALRYDGTTYKLFVNGAVEATAPSVSPPITYDDSTGIGFIIGGMAGGSNSLDSIFNGVVQNVAIYGAALSDARMAAHASAAGLAAGGGGGASSVSQLRRIQQRMGY